jgi:hypothetical protein
MTQEIDMSGLYEKLKDQKYEIEEFTNIENLRLENGRNHSREGQKATACTRATRQNSCIKMAQGESNLF